MRVFRFVEERQACCADAVGSVRQRTWILEWLISPVCVAHSQATSSRLRRNTSLASYESASPDSENGRSERECEENIETSVAPTVSRVLTPFHLKLIPAPRLASSHSSSAEPQPASTHAAKPAAWRSLRTAYRAIACAATCRLVDILGVPLEKARFKLALPAHTAKAGVRSFAELSAHADKFLCRIDGIEADAPANDMIERMVAANAYGLGGWRCSTPAVPACWRRSATLFAARRACCFCMGAAHCQQSLPDSLPDRR